MQIDELKNVSKEKKDVVIVSIYVHSFNPYTETIENVTKKKEEKGAEWMFALDTGETNVTGKFIENYQRHLSIPTLFIIDKDGFISFSHIGVVKKEKILEEIGT